MIAGFCGESEADHAASLDLLESVGYEQAFLYAYSLRDKTHAARHYQVCLAARALAGWLPGCLDAWVHGCMALLPLPLPLRLPPAV